MKTKTITASILLLLLLNVQGLFSNTNPVQKPQAGEAEKTIRELIKFPKVLLPLNQTGKQNTYRIEVLFTTDQFGKVNFVLAKTKDPLLKSEIEKQFLDLKLKQVKSEVVNSVILSFKLV